MIRSRYLKKEDIPQEYVGLYTERKGADGEMGWECTEIEGIKTQQDVERVREAARKEKEDHQATQAELKIAKAELDKAADTIKGLEASGKKGDDDGKDKKELVMENARLTRENETYKTKNTELTESFSSLETTVTKGKIKDVLRKAYEGKVRPDAMDVTVDQTADNFEFSNGELLTRSSLGDRAGLEPVAFAERLTKEQPWLVPPSKSGKAGGSDKKTGDRDAGGDGDGEVLELEEMIPPRKN